MVPVMVHCVCGTSASQFAGVQLIPGTTLLQTPVRDVQQVRARPIEGLFHERLYCMKPTQNHDDMCCS